MKTITKELAIDMLNSGIESLISSALSAFPELKPKNTFADICISAGTTVEEFYKKRVGYSNLALSTEECALIVHVLNRGWIPNWDDNNEEKHYIWWDMRNKKLRFSSSDCYFNLSPVPAHLCFKSEATIEEAKNFVEYFEKLFHTKFEL